MSSLLRPLLLVAPLFLVAWVGRMALLPTDFGRYGDFRAAAVTEESRYLQEYQGKEGCRRCHKENAHHLQQSRHQAIACEACHDAGRAHEADPKAPGRIARDGQLELCWRCHRKLTSRPRKFPQVVQASHYPGQRCNECHPIHRPMKIPKISSHDTSEENRRCLHCHKVKGGDSKLPHNHQGWPEQGRDGCLKCHKGEK